MHLLSEKRTSENGGFPPVRRGPEVNAPPGACLIGIGESPGSCWRYTLETNEKRSAALCSGLELLAGRSSPLDSVCAWRPCGGVFYIPAGKRPDKEVMTVLDRGSSGGARLADGGCAARGHPPPGRRRQIPPCSLVFASHEISEGPPGRRHFAFKRKEPPWDRDVGPRRRAYLELRGYTSHGCDRIIICGAPPPGASLRKDIRGPDPGGGACRREFNISCIASRQVCTQTPYFSSQLRAMARGSCRLAGDSQNNRFVSAIPPPLSGRLTCRGAPG